MSAGRGVTHSEFNDSAEEPCHLFQIWILPDQRGLAPGYQQKAFSVAERTDRMCLIASRDGRDGSVSIHQDASVFAALLSEGAHLRHSLERERHAWLQIVRGTLELQGQELEAGAGAALGQETGLEIRARSAAELLLFDLA